MVVRYFGGVKLGTGGLIVAYREAAADAIRNSEISYKLIEEKIDYTFPYIMMDKVMKVVKEMQPRILSQSYDNICVLSLSIRKSLAGQLKAKLAKLSFE